MLTDSRCAWVFTWPNGITTNHLYRSTERLGQRVLTGAANRWRSDVIDQVILARHRLPAGLLTVEVALYPPDAVKRDVDGPIKLLVDSIFLAYRALYEQQGYPLAQAKKLADDYRVKRLTAERHDPDRARPRLEVAITPWSA